MTWSPLITGVSETSDCSSRNGRDIDTFIIHHAVSTNLQAALSLYQPGGREVSPNYAGGPNGELIGVVPEELRAWTSGSAAFDGRAITIEQCNINLAPNYDISDAGYETLAKLAADLHTRHGVPLQWGVPGIIQHKDIYNNWGDSYATACAGPHFDINRVINRAKQILAEPDEKAKPQRRKDMTSLYHKTDTDQRDGKPILYALAGDGPGAAGWLEISDGNLANELSVQHGRSAFLTTGTWETWKKLYTGSQPVSGISSGGTAPSAKENADAVKLTIAGDFSAIPAGVAAELGKRIGNA